MLMPDRIGGLETILADAVALKYLAAPLEKAQLDDLIQIPPPIVAKPVGKAR
jgi:hypothetical protein